MPDSATVGISGAAEDRFAVDTATPRSRPLFTCGIATTMPEKNIATCPPSTSISAGSSNAANGSLDMAKVP